MFDVEQQPMMSDVEQHVIALRSAAHRLAADLARSSDETALRLRARLCDSVVRPLEAVGPAATSEPGAAAARDAEQRGDTAGTDADSTPSLPLDSRIWELARAATALFARTPGLVAVGEAAAALQDLAVGLAGDPSASSRLAELQAMQAGLSQQIQVIKNGPYLVTNARVLSNWLGEPLPVRPLMALCRCGASRIKPFCDGTHATIGFNDAKDPVRVPDRRDTYSGQQVTIYDNRGLCQHSGLCTDRLATVFRLRQEPFVAPSGGRLDEIIRAVRDCPSGALSYAIDGVEARDAVDYHGTRPPGIVVTKDGPYRVTGGLPLHDATGADVERNAGASREHYALCRCGHSRNKPFCSGMHWYVEFHHPVSAPEQDITVFEWLGGLPALLRMARLFYEKHIPQDPLLAPVFATMSMDLPERVARWLAEVFGGPKLYSTTYGGYTRMIAQHMGKNITEEMRERWVTLLLRSAQEAGLPNDPAFRSVFSSYLEWESRLLVEHCQGGAKPPEQMPMPRWDWNSAAGHPGLRVSAPAPAQEEVELPAAPPAAGEPLHFEEHIKPLFRPRDQQSMLFAFDLWSYDDVSVHADAILARVRSGTMPCDGPWPDTKIEVLQRWIDAGKPR